VLIEDSRKLPVEIVVADHTAHSTIISVVEHLQWSMRVGKPANRVSPEPKEFASAYWKRLWTFSRIQDDYRKRRKAFDTLFKYRPRDVAGSFAYRWERVLARMDMTDRVNWRD